MVCSVNNLPLPLLFFPLPLFLYPVTLNRNGRYSVTVTFFPVPVTFFPVTVTPLFRYPVTLNSNDCYSVNRNRITCLFVIAIHPQEYYSTVNIFSVMGYPVTFKVTTVTQLCPLPLLRYYVTFGSNGRYFFRYRYLAIPRYRYFFRYRYLAIPRYRYFLRYR